VAFYDGGTRCVSEGLGWGMVITAMMAGQDAEAQKIFDGMFLYFQDHRSRGNPDLMSWQVSDCGDTNTDNSATDGDLDIAYGLLLADQQWGSDSQSGINYLAEAEKVIEAIKASDVNPEIYSIMLGDWTHPGSAEHYYGARTSDFMGDHFRAFFTATGDPVWNSVIDTFYNVSEAIQAHYSPQTGLLPDFVEDLNSSPRPADAGFLEGQRDGWYAYNACRVPMRIGIDYLISGDPRAKQVLDRLNAWIKVSTGGQPNQILDGYQMDGTPTSYGADQMSFVGPFGVGAMVSADNQEWLNDIWDDVLARNVNQQAYYENTIKLLSMLAMSGNWWNPGLSQ
jgi:endo-1,4-beta-D-glucanase Y